MVFAVGLARAGQRDHAIEILLHVTSDKARDQLRAARFGALPYGIEILGRRISQQRWHSRLRQQNQISARLPRQLVIALQSMLVQAHVPALGLRNTALNQTNRQRSGRLSPRHLTQPQACQPKHKQGEQTSAPAPNQQRRRQRQQEADAIHAQHRPPSRQQRHLA